MNRLAFRFRCLKRLCGSLILVLPLCLVARPAVAQTLDDVAVASNLAAQSQSQTPQPKEAPPPRGFVSALFHNLGDDVKHVPRRNTIYWLAGGAALTAAVHPADRSINAHLVGSDVADRLFKPGHVVGATDVQLSAAVLTYLIGGWRDQPRARSHRSPAAVRGVYAGDQIRRPSGEAGSHGFRVSIRSRLDHDGLRYGVTAAPRMARCHPDLHHCDVCGDLAAS